MKLALFDFDGTISTHDSFREFLIFALGYPRFFIGILANFLILTGYVLKVIDSHQAKEKLFGYFFKGWSEEKLDATAREFVKKRLIKIIKKSAREKIKWHKNEKHRIIVVSASFEFYLKHWCRIQNLELLATKIEFKDGIFSGKFASKNCRGPEKVNRIKKLLNPDEYDYIYAYGDSSGDREMLEIAHEKGYRNFN